MLIKCSPQFPVAQQKKFNNFMQIKIKSIRKVHTKNRVPFICTGSPVTTLPTHNKHSRKTDCATFQGISNRTQLYLVHAQQNGHTQVCNGFSYTSSDLLFPSGILKQAKHGHTLPTSTIGS